MRIDLRVNGSIADYNMQPLHRHSYCMVKTIIVTMNMQYIMLSTSASYFK